MYCSDSPGLVFMPHLKTVVEVNALWPSHVLELWLGVGKGMLPVKYFYSNKAFFVPVGLHGNHKIVIKMS